MPVRQYASSLFLLLALICACSRASAAQQPDAWRILFLNSYDRGNSWSDDVESGIRTRLTDSAREIEMSVEYLDTRRFTGEEVQENMAATLAVKYRHYSPHLLIVSDNAAFDFALKHRERLFPRLPIVFCGYNDFRPEVLSGHTNITGVNEEADILANVETALQVHPQAKTLVFVISTAEVSSKRIAEIAESTIFPLLRENFELVILKDASMDEMRRTFATLPQDAVLFLPGQTSDMGDDRPLNQVENARLITAACPVPVYAFWDFQLGTGVLGGRILSGIDQGKAAAEMALRILDGTSPESIPVMLSAPARVIFDHDVMKRFHLSESDLPPGSQIINRPVTVWTQYRWQIMTILVLLGLQSLLIAKLMREMRQRQVVLAELKDERALLESRVTQRTQELQEKQDQLSEALLTRNLLLDNALVVITLVRHRRFAWVSNHITAMFGYTPAEVIGRSTAFLYYYSDDYQRLWAEEEPVLMRGESYRGDYCFRCKDGRPLWCAMSAKALDPADLDKGILFVVADINDRKLMEQALRDAKAHLELLATTDQLTDLANRRKLTDVLGDEIGRSNRYKQPFSIILLDIDHFKDVNDTHGHDAGDHVLKQVGRVLGQNVRNTDKPGRWGGEEFMIVCPATRLEDALILAEHVRQRIEDHDFGLPLRITASFGVAEYTPIVDLEILIKAADEALYKAKSSGRNCIRGERG